MVNRYIHKDDNPDLTAERTNCPFDTNALAAVFYGGEQKFMERQKVFDFVQNTAELRNLNSDVSYGSKLDWVKKTFENYVVAKSHIDQIVNVEDRDNYEYYKRLTLGLNGAPGTLADVIVIPMLDACCDEQQRKLFYERAKRYEMFTAYAQTELGHGTNTKALETTATFDPKSQEFILNTPTLSAYKWWPGNLGKVCSWAIVMAKLITDGKDYGMHPFFVQIRDESTHKPLDGVTVGEIGTTFGAVANDNGYLGFRNVRVPKISLLAKHFRVQPNGRYVAGVHGKLAYVGMMFVRAVMTHELIGPGLAGAATIATRYSCVRRQGEIEPGKGEVKILEYRTQQHRVLPQIVRAICFFFAGQSATRLYLKMVDDIRHGDPALMEDVHAITSGLKAVCSFQAAQGIEQCRLACGGHGYSIGSGIPHIYTLAVGGCTYEGDNLVMLLQLARFIMKRVTEAKSAKKPKRLAEPAEHLFTRPQPSSQYGNSKARFSRWENIRNAFEHISQRLAFKAHDLLAQEIKNGRQTDVAFNNVSIDMTKAAKAYTRVFLANTFAETVKSVADPAVKKVLEDCLDVYLHYELLDCRSDLLEDTYFTGAQLDLARVQLNAALQTLRPNAVNVVDSFDLADRLLNSQIGARDGNAYENLFKWAQQSPLNEYDVLPFHHETLGKYTQRIKSSASKL